MKWAIMMKKDAQYLMCVNINEKNKHCDIKKAKCLKCSEREG